MLLLFVFLFIKELRIISNMNLNALDNLYLIFFMLTAYFLMHQLYVHMDSVIG